MSVGDFAHLSYMQAYFLLCLCTALGFSDNKTATLILENLWRPTFLLMNL